MSLFRKELLHGKPTCEWLTHGIRRAVPSLLSKSESIKKQNYR